MAMKILLFHLDEYFQLNYTILSFFLHEKSFVWANFRQYENKSVRERTLQT